ncbi:hypothetical protein Q3G72_016166 [Acer saccharum]|nr:hypothetical protein Q3G72_016166 [Acer saccharum]
MYSAAVTSQLRGDLLATGNLSPTKLRLDAKIRLIDQKVRCKKKAMVLFVKMIVSCELQIRSAPNNARYVFAQHEAGHFLVGYLLGDLPKALECLCKVVTRFEPKCMHCPCMQVAIPKMLKKDNGQLDNRFGLIHNIVSDQVLF